MIDDDTTSSPPAPAEQGGRRHGKLALAVVLILGVAAGVALVLIIESWQRSNDDKNVLVPVVTTAPAVSTTPAITPSPPAPDADAPGNLARSVPGPVRRRRRSRRARGDREPPLGKGRRRDERHGPP